MTSKGTMPKKMPLPPPSEFNRTQTAPQGVIRPPPSPGQPPLSPSQSRIGPQKSPPPQRKIADSWNSTEETAGAAQSSPGPVRRDSIEASESSILSSPSQIRNSENAIQLPEFATYGTKTTKNYKPTVIILYFISILSKRLFALNSTHFCFFLAGILWSSHRIRSIGSLNWSSRSHCDDCSPFRRKRFYF